MGNASKAEARLDMATLLLGLLFVWGRIGFGLHPGLRNLDLCYKCACLSWTGAAGGWTAPGEMTSAQRKEAEANGSASQVQNGYYDPNNPNFAYVPPPAYNEMPPSYSDSNKKND